ncbi:MAG: hypothetical protein HQ501_12570 [Rhodospirillales bacterium]|nr:hypothetical protein [Rhodospirillales bacterium]
MIVLVQAIGAVVGAFSGLMLGTLVKFSVGGAPVDLRYGFMLLGILLGYALARFFSRSPEQVDVEE